MLPFSVLLFDMFSTLHDLHDSMQPFSRFYYFPLCRFATLLSCSLSLSPFCCFVIFLFFYLHVLSYSHSNVY